MRNLNILSSLLFVISIQAQQSVFYSNPNDDNFNIGQFGLEVYSLNFIKNNEYFNFISDGYTLLGTQLHPELIYNASINTQFKLGVFLLKNFGENNIDYTIPTFSFNYLKGNHRFTIGNLFAKNNHNLIEPMMASEKIINSDVIETGVDYQYNNDRLFANLWINWETYIKKNEDYREVFTIGMSGNLSLFNGDNSKLSIPIQHIYYHRGGQINKKKRDENNTANTLNMFNTVIGVRYEQYLNNENSLHFGCHYLLYNINSIKEEFPFSSGSAHYIIGSYKSKKIEFTLAYFFADKFISAKGNDMFQTYSVKTDNNYWNGILDYRYANHTEKDRNLIFTKINYRKQLAKNIEIGVQVEGFYQLNDGELDLELIGNSKHQFDYSYGVYLIFSEIFSF